MMWFNTYKSNKEKSEGKYYWKEQENNKFKLLFEGRIPADPDNPKKCYKRNKNCRIEYEKMMLARKKERQELFSGGLI